MNNYSFSDWKTMINAFGEFKSKKAECDYFKYQWKNRKNYYLFSYFMCTFLFFFHGFFDFKRIYVSGSPEILMMTRGLFLIICTFFIYHYKKSQTPKYVQEFLFALQLISVFVIFLLTYFTGGKSETLPIGVMIMYASFYIMLPGRPIYALISSILITMVYLGLGDSTKSNFLPFSFIIISSNIILWFFCRNQNRYYRIEYLSHNHFNELVEMKTKLLNVLAHDIRSPLQVILMHSLNGKKSCENKNFNKAQKSLTSITENTRKIEALLKDFLNWTLKMQVQTNNNQKSNDLNATIQNVIDYLQDLAHLKNIQFITQLDQIELSHEIVLMETVFRNLLSNSIKFSKNGSVISISSNKVDEKRTEIIIKDGGTPLCQQKIQEMKSGRIQSTNGTEGEVGFGHGITLVRTFLGYHNAFLDIEAAEDGNIFKIILKH